MILLGRMLHEQRKQLFMSSLAVQHIFVHTLGIVPEQIFCRLLQCFTFLVDIFSWSWGSFYILTIVTFFTQLVLRFIIFINFLQGFVIFLLEFYST
jgi:hypothetical protein